MCVPIRELHEAACNSIHEAKGESSLVAFLLNRTDSRVTNLIRPERLGMGSAVTWRSETCVFASVRPVMD